MTKTPFRFNRPIFFIENHNHHNLHKRLFSTKHVANEDNNYITHQCHNCRSMPKSSACTHDVGPLFLYTWRQGGLVGHHRRRRKRREELVRSRAERTPGSARTCAVHRPRRTSESAGGQSTIHLGGPDADDDV